jgi:hypothetical protein
MQVIAKFLGDCILQYKSRLIEFHPTEKIQIGSISCTGEATKDKLRIATGGNLSDWLPIFIHETCHLDQDQENPNWFETAEKAHQSLEQWLAGKAELDNPLQVAKEVMRLEHDCEARTLAKIAKYNLPVNRGEYSQKANAYILSYHITVADRSWKSAPYNDPKIWTRMPKELLPLSRVLSPDHADLTPFFGEPSSAQKPQGAKAWWVKGAHRRQLRHAE